MKKIVFITPHDAEYGFSLAGIRQQSVEPEETEAVLRAAVDNPDTGLIIIDERLVNNDTEELIRGLEHGWSGVILVMPSPEKFPPEVEDYAARLIRRAIGYHVRLNM